MASTIFQDYNPATPIVAAWLNDVNTGVYNQLPAVQTGAFIKGAVSGTVNAIAFSLPSVLTPYTAPVDGQTVCIISPGPNTGATTIAATIGGTLQATVPLVKGSNIGLSAGDTGIAGYPMTIKYSATFVSWVLTNPATSVVAAAQTTQGSFKNLAASASGASAIVTGSFDEIALEAPGNVYYIARAGTLSITMSNTPGANSIDAGTVAANTWYYGWVIYNPTSNTVAALGSLSPTAPTMPTGYTYAALFTSFRTDGTVNKYPLSYKQFGRDQQFVVGSGTNVTALTQIISGVQGTPGTPVWVSASWSSIAPPNAAKVKLIFQTAGGTCIAAPNSQYGSWASLTNRPPMSASAASVFISETCEFAPESANFYFASDTAGQALCGFGYTNNF